MADAAIILAAGASERMGSPKQLLPWGEFNLLQKVINEVFASNFDAIIVVVGANSEKVLPSLPSTVASVINYDWEKGMGSSISCGIASMQQLSIDFKSVMIVLADQPLMDTIYFNKLLSCFKENKERIIATNYMGSAGVPAIFDELYFNRLASLATTYGAKELLAENKEDCWLMNAGNKTKDIDTKEDYKYLNNKFN